MEEVEKFLDEETVKSKFVDAFNLLSGRREVVYETCDIAIETLTGVSELDDKIIESQQELDIITSLVEN